MTVEEALVAHLTGYGELADLLGDNVAPGQLELKASLPAIRFLRAGRRPTQHRSSSRPNHSRSRFQFDVWGSSYQQVVTVRSALFDAMGEFQRTSAPRVDVSLLQDDRDIFEAEPGRWRAIVDYFIWHTEG